MSVMIGLPAARAGAANTTSKSVATIPTQSSLGILIPSIRLPC